MAAIAKRKETKKKSLIPELCPYPIKIGARKQSR
jgi:hypothetical protein